MSCIRTNLVVFNTGVGVVMSRVHCPLVDDDSRQVVNVIRHVDREAILSDGVRQHVHRQGEVDVAVHFLG
jgi:chloramphenicol 3-O-phosphotransferase